MDNGNTRDSGINGQADSAENTFKELLKLCKGDLKEITKKLQQIAQNETVEDNLRKEIIDQGRKMNELRAEHEQTMYDQNQDHINKLEELQVKQDSDMKKMSQRLKEDIQQKNDKIKELERNG